MSFLKQIHPLMLLYQLAFVSVIASVLIMFNFDGESAVFYSVLLYFLLFYIARSMLTYHHRMGIRSYRKQQFQEAVDYFEKSRDFFARHPGLDRFRFAVLFSVSRLSYLALAENNAGFCYAKLGKLQEAERAFTRSLELAPGNPMAQSALEVVKEERAKRKKKKK